MSNSSEIKEDATKGDTVVEQGLYNLIANIDQEFKITHLILKSESGAKRIWRVSEISEKNISFNIEKFS